MKKAAALTLCALMVSTAVAKPYDVLIKNGTIYDGAGGTPYAGSVAITGGKIVAVGKVKGKAKTVIDAKGKAVSPGFINMLSWANESLIVDGRGMGDTLQGVTLEVFGEGESEGPYTDEMAATNMRRQGDIKYDVTWRKFSDYLETMVKRGVSPNLASFVGATTVRVNVLGENDVDPNSEQLAKMRGLVREAMKEGAVGVGSSLGYVPANFAETPELTALSAEAAKCDGMYISHIRSEGEELHQAVGEVIEIAEKAGVRAEIYHFKASGRPNWVKRQGAVDMIEAAQKRGLQVTANMYTYPAAATGLDISMPNWVQEGGVEKWIERLKDPANRARVADEMRKPGVGWENSYYNTGPKGMLLVGFKNPKLKPLTGKTLAEVAEMRGKTPEETAMDLVIEDGTRVGTVYFAMDEADVKKNVALPWMTFGSDGSSQAPEGVFLESSTHPRSYGNFARLLGKYVRDEGVLSLQDAVRKLTSLPASRLKIRDRGLLKAGYAADVVIFDPATIRDNATFDKPQQFATGVSNVIINGVEVVKDGTHTGAKPGQVVRGPGWTGWPGGGACKG